jgi:DNA-binding GntR family transcriptional regulator
VEIAAFRGARVRRPTAAELLEAYAVRAELEALGVVLALPRLTDANLEELQRYLDTMRRAAAEGDVHAEASADASFHGRLVELANNATLLRVWRLLEPFSRTYITIVVPGSDRRRIAELHAAILEALRSGDPQMTADSIRRHFADAQSMLAGLWAEPEPSRTAQRPIRALRAAARRATVG